METTLTGRTKRRGIYVKSKSMLMLSGQGENKVWMHYLNGIIAADLYSAVFLSSWLRHAVMTRQYTNALEVADLQTYKVIRKNPDVLIAVRNRGRIPFVFVIGKN